MPLENTVGMLTIIKATVCVILAFILSLSTHLGWSPRSSGTICGALFLTATWMAFDLCVALFYADIATQRKGQCSKVE
jgi:hypothetical protein